MNRRQFLMAGAAGTAALGTVNLFAIGRPKAATAINLYTARHYDTDEVLYTEFTRQTGIAINRVDATAEKLVERMQAEGPNSPADVFVTVDAGRIEAAKVMGLLQPMASSTLSAAVPAHLRDPDGYWFGMSKRARVIMVDKSRVKPGDITRYEDLADPKWKGKLLIRSSTNIYNLSLTGSILAASGAEPTEAWARGIATNLARPPRGGDSDQIKAVAAGEGEICVANTYYLGNLVRSTKDEERAIADKIAVVFPNQADRGTHVNIAGGGIARYAKNIDGARQFLEYLVGGFAQRVFAESNSEYPVVSGIEVPSSIMPFGQFKEDQLNAGVFAKNNAEALRIMDRAGWK